MPKVNWLERQRNIKDPRETAIQEMYLNLKKITEPRKITPVFEIPEFSDFAVRDGSVSAIVAQGRMASTEHEPIRSDNVSKCNIFLIKTPQESGTDKYTLVHIWAGDLSLNHEGNKRADISKITNNQSVAIAVTGTRSDGFITTAREFKYEGITTIKHIEIPTGSRYISVVYRPEKNDVLVRVGSDEDATEVFEYEGF